ncbi:hypothetical protein J2R62_18175, partial [Plesiomonas shigelloides]
MLDRLLEQVAIVTIRNIVSFQLRLNDATFWTILITQHADINMRTDNHTSNATTANVALDNLQFLRDIQLCRRTVLFGQIADIQHMG